MKETKQCIDCVHVFVPYEEGICKSCGDEEEYKNFQPREKSSESASMRLHTVTKTLTDEFAMHCNFPMEDILAIFKIEYGIEKPTINQVLEFRSHLKFMEAEFMMQAREGKELSFSKQGKE